MKFWPVFCRVKLNVTALILIAAVGSGTSLALTPDQERSGIPLTIMPDPKALASVSPDLVPKGGWPPLWIDARAVELTADGRLDLNRPTPFGHDLTWSELFSHYEPGPYGPKDTTATAAEGQSARSCHPIGEIFVDEVLPPNRSSLLHTIRAAETVVLGRVLGRSYGFYRGVPGQLIMLASLRTFGLGVRAKSDTFFFFMPVGEFAVGNERICKSDARYAKPPSVGDDVFVFARPPVGEKHDVLDIHDGGEVVPIHSDGTAVLPGENALRDDGRVPASAEGPRTRAQILAALEGRADR